MKFIPYLKKHYRTITLTSYLLPILFAVIVSLAHVITFWEISNPASWALFLSVAIEVAVLSSIAASRISNWSWLPFSIVTLIQIVGNVFFSYTNIDITSTLFKNWVELFDPLFNWIGLDTAGDLIVHKRILATFSGAVIPLISITFFQFFIRTMRMEVPEDLDNVKPPAPEPEIGVVDFSEQVREKTIKKWEDVGSLEGLEGRTKTGTALFESNPSQIVTDPQLNIHPDILRSMRQNAAYRPNYSYAPKSDDSDVSVNDPAQLKLSDIDNPPTVDPVTGSIPVKYDVVPDEADHLLISVANDSEPVVEEIPEPQDRIIVFEDEKKN